MFVVAGLRGELRQSVGAPELVRGWLVDFSSIFGRVVIEGGMKTHKRVVERVADEISNVELGDERRTKRVKRIVEKLAKNPAVSLPAALGNDAEVQGAYRLMNNEAVDFDSVLTPHLDATAQKAAEKREVLALHDTTDCTFPTLDPTEIGFLNTGKAGFRLHYTLVVDGDVWRRPLGVIYAETLHRSKPPRRKNTRKRKKKSGAQTIQKTDREFERWSRGILAASEGLKQCDNVIHVADREGDSYELMSTLFAAKQRFIIRLRVNRRGRENEADDGAWSTVQEIASRCDGLLERQVPLSRRKAKGTPRMNKAHPPRKMRLAKLRFAATTVVIPRPSYLRDPIPRELTLNLVHVFEVDAPPNEKPVEWFLYTTEAIDTPEQVAAIVDKYRTRWTIEEFNAALKTGCAYESRQFESRHALLNMLAISLPIACEVLWLRSRARTQPNAPGTDVASPVQIELLRMLGSRKLSTNPTAEEILLAVAGLGGHLKRNGPPGWKVLYRGMTLLLAYEAGWHARDGIRRETEM